MSLLKGAKAEDNGYSEEDIAKKEFLANMSYKIRNPLNSICGMSEIVTKAVKEDYDKEQILEYMRIISDAAVELKDVVDECFYEYENSSVKTIDGKDVTEEDYSLLHNLRILVVEDSTVSQMIMKELLENHGSMVTLCNDGKEAVDVFEKSIPGTFDIILMDIKMPIMDGYEATDKIRRSTHHQAKSIPIIAMTAETFADEIKRALKSGMNAHVAKPFGIDKIVSAIKSVK